jgi:MscS family membrane protein
LIARGFAARIILLGFLALESAWSQAILPAPAPSQPEVPKDALGRTTPRGTVRGFLTVAGKGDYAAATHYLNTRLRGEAANVLAHQLFTVLNRRLPARINEISDQPQGSLTYPAEPEKDLVGTIESDLGDMEILVERVDRKNAESVWLFSRQTLDAIPELYAEVNNGQVQTGIAKYLLETRIAHIALIHWLALFVGLPALHFLAVFLNRFLSRIAGQLVRRLRKNPNLPNPQFLPIPLRLLLVALLIRWAISSFSLPLLARQFWSSIAVLLAIVGCTWLIMYLNRTLEEHVRVRLGRRNLTGALSIVRFARWAIDALLIFIGLLVVLHYLGFNPTTALAGLGVGGIAVALAAQKTLENVIAGVSLISDQAIRVGDFLKVGDTLGTVSDIGLRSTRIRTLDRTVVNLPNGQIANASLENFSLRDQFWFHPIFGVPYETSVAQVRSILHGVTELLFQSHDVNKSSLRVRLLRFGTSSLDVEIFAYISARDWSDFLRLQEELLLQIMEVVTATGTHLALPSQTTYLKMSAAEELPQAPLQRPAVEQKRRKHERENVRQHQ